MGSGLTNPPQGGVGALPDIPVPSYTAQAQQTTAGMQAAGWFDSFWKAFWEHQIPGLSAALAVGATVANDLMALGMKILGAFQAANNPGFYTLLAQTLTDLMGIEFDSTSISNSFKAGGTAAANTAVGAKFFQMLTTELGTQGTLSPDTGVTAAEAWLGYAMNFAIREGNVEVLTSLIPEEFRFLEGLREYGVNLAQVLGLGRLGRLVLQPLIKILIADPLTWHFNSQYRPTMLPIGSMFKAYWRGGMSLQQLTTYLQWMGYRDVDLAQLEIDSQSLPSITAFVAMTRCGYITSDQLSARLGMAAIPLASQPEYLNGIEAQRAESHLNETVANYVTLLKNRWIDMDGFQTQLGQLGLNAKEIAFAAGSVAPLLEYRTKELSLAELEAAYVAGLIDITVISDWATRMGYNPTDSQIIQYQVLLKAEKAVSADQLATWKLKISCLNALAKKQPPPPGFDALCNPN